MKKGLIFKPSFMGVNPYCYYLSLYRPLSTFQPVYYILTPVYHFLSYPSTPWAFTEAIEICEILRRNQLPEEIPDVLPCEQRGQFTVQACEKVSGHGLVHLRFQVRLGPDSFGQVIHELLNG